MNTLRQAIKYLDQRTTELNWEALYRELLPRIYNYFRYRYGDGPLAEDLTATTFEKAWRARASYRRDIGAFSTWLFTIARNVAADYQRSQRQILTLDDIPNAADECSLEETVQRRIDTHRLSTLLAALPDHERELIALKYGMELTNRDIARLTGETESNIGTRLFRIVQRLRSKWEAEP